MDVLLLIGMPALMVVAFIFAVRRWGGREIGEPWTEEEEDDFDDDEIHYWISQGWDGQGPPPGPF